ncbi:alkaline phosphatase [Sporobolomyces salmoneus]|uniref:alkaline phosphatase n=1 Tax=Sporobolomyces salmoneus TaxID=183962 RepID=UPI00317028CB
MSRPRTPPQFILDEETAEEDDLKHPDSRRSSLDSAASSLLLHSYPPDPSSERGVPSSSSPSPDAPRPSHYTISIPSRAAVSLARSQPAKRPRHPKLVIGGLFSLFGFAYVATQVLALFTRFNGQPKVQVVLMISDGMGPASETFARTYLRYLYDTNSTTILSTTGERRSLLNESVWAGLEKEFWDGGGGTPLDDILVGSSRTRSSNSLITDSAAGATALSCLLKTFNGAIGVTPSKLPCGTILESAHRQGFSTGIVTTSRLTHATPASFYSHVVDRDLESEIARFLLPGTEGDGGARRGRTVDLAFGGGRCFFVGNSTKGSCRTDNEDLLKAVEGVRVVEGMKGLREWKDEELAGRGNTKERSVIGFFGNDHMDYEIDRQRTEHLVDEQPSLKEMTTHALKWLKRKGEKAKGFFVMIEGARIDMAAHNNDPIAHLSDVLAYYETVQYVKQWVKEQNDQEGIPTVLVSVSDHETGGLTLGRQLKADVYPEYLWYPEVLSNATHSTAHLGKQIADRYPMTTRDWIETEIYEKGLGILDVATSELDEIWKERSDAYKANRVLADAISRRAQVGWSTAGHSGVDVNLYAYGHNSTGLKGCVENTQVSEFIAHTMGLNLDVVTIELNKNLKSWFSADAGHSIERTQGLKHYEGEF